MTCSKALEFFEIEFYSRFVPFFHRLLPCRFVSDFQRHCLYHCPGRFLEQAQCCVYQRFPIHFLHLKMICQINLPKPQELFIAYYDLVSIYTKTYFDISNWRAYRRRLTD